MSIDSIQTPVAQSLGERMKSYEASTEQHLPPEQPVLIRIDGHGFSKFTRGFEKPFDQRIHDVMVLTSTDLLSYFAEASLAYTQSDEITLIFPTSCRAFNGRVTKIASLAAGYTTARFNYHLQAVVADLAEEKQGIAHFDARVFPVPSVEEVLNNLIWRAKIDCRRNSISGFGRSFYSTKELQGLTSDALVEKIKREHNIDFWTSTPKQYEGTGVDKPTGAEVTTTRTRMRSKDVSWWEFNETNLNLVRGRFWDSLPNPPPEPSYKWY
ncbi:tRNAHis guanylyltransferase-domain-containing protein [Mycena rebaudengoi]|nr:tRNAHis guanylyltransferase-domain-containing protein [Mycena rebaudengoi]